MQDLINQIQNASIENLIVAHLAGSHSYGTNIETSDVDVRGVFCAKRVNVATPFFPYKEQTIPSMEDAKVYEVSNFLNLYTQGNPNILETLWVDEQDVLLNSPAYSVLKENRQALLSKKVAFTFTGYALSQLKRIKGHNKWINNPKPFEPPKQTDYVKLVQNFTKDKVLPNEFSITNYPENSRVIPFGDNLFGLYVDRELTKGYSPFDKYYTLNTQFEDESSAGYGPPDFMVRWKKEQYTLAKQDHRNYWNWKENRNPARAALEEEHSFDTKHAMHLVRLLRMGEEILTTGEVKVKRPDAQELLDVRAGAWSYEELLEYAEEKDNQIRTVLYKSSDLPKSPDIKLASKILTQIQDLYW